MMAVCVCPIQCMDMEHATAQIPFGQAESKTMAYNAMAGGK